MLREVICFLLRVNVFFLNKKKILNGFYKIEDYQCKTIPLI